MSNFIMQWMPLNGITVNGISRLLESDFMVPFAIHYYIKMTSYCYHSINGIRYGLAQSDPIKQRLLYLSFQVANLYLLLIVSLNVCTKLFFAYTVIWNFTFLSFC
jgi:hypothetical protein